MLPCGLRGKLWTRHWEGALLRAGEGRASVQYARRKQHGTVKTSAKDENTSTICQDSRDGKSRRGLGQLVVKCLTVVVVWVAEGAMGALAGETTAVGVANTEKTLLPLGNLLYERKE